MTAQASPVRPRWDAIDWVRGVVMILMALDHVRFFFTNASHPPEAVETTTLPLFLTRWVTHFCAPAFFFLAGTGAFLRGRRGGLAGYLIPRGVMLIILELTLVGFGWCFRPGYNFAGVIWGLGWSMILLGLLSRLGTKTVFAAGALIVAGHHALESVAVPAGLAGTMWHFLYVPGDVALGGGTWFVLYPLLPWCGVMFLGYAAGVWYLEESGVRFRRLAGSGAAAVILFLVLRPTNVYGNPPTSFVPGGSGHFEVQRTPVMTVIELLNTEKYPPSLQFLLMTLGPMLLALAWVERWLRRRQRGGITRAVLVFGRVPLFYYVAHLYLIHLMALLVAVVDSQPWAWLGWNGSPVRPSGYGYSLPAVYLAWLAAVALLYPPCAWYEKRKSRGAAGVFRYV